jgi:hypothetical protein
MCCFPAQDAILTTTKLNQNTVMSISFSFGFRFRSGVNGVRTDRFHRTALNGTHSGVSAYFSAFRP